MIDLPNVSRILLIKPSALGDVIHTLPVLVKLRKRFPEARIDWLITPENADIIRAHPARPELVPFPRRELSQFGRDWKATSGALKLLRNLRRNRYDLVIDLHGQARSAVFCLATRAPVRIGFPPPEKLVTVGQHGWRGAREGSWLAYTHYLPIHTLDVHAIDRYLWVGELLGFDDGPAEGRVYIPNECHESLARLLPNKFLSKPYAVLMPGTKWQTKHWHPLHFAKLGSELIASGFQVVIAGASADRERCHLLANACHGSLNIGGMSSTGELGALIEGAAICVTNDSGPMHYAVALNAPVVAIFGPTNPLHIGPYQQPESVVRADVPCAPCHYRSFHQCPHQHRCMTLVSPEAVMQRVEALLGDRLPTEARRRNNGANMAPEHVNVQEAESVQS